MHYYPSWWQVAKQTREACQMLVQCWTDVADARPTLNQYCSHVTCRTDK